MNLADQLQLQSAIDQVREACRAHQRVMVVGPTGSGRSQVLQALSEDESVVAVDAPALSDADAAIHPLFTAASSVGAQALQDVSSANSLEDQANRLADAVVAADKTLALRLPPSWRSIAGRLFHADPEWQLMAERANTVFATLVGHERLHIVVLGEPGLRVEGACQVRLLPMLRSARDLGAAGSWGKYTKAADEFFHSAEASGITMTPVQARLGVGLVALGETTESALGCIRFGGTVPSSLELLEKRLVQALKRRPERAQGVARFALARFGIRRDRVGDVSGLPEDELPLITECLAYGDDILTMHDRVRGALLSISSSDKDEEMEDAHFRLSEYHRTLDGTRKIHESPSARDWLERAFHLGHSGAQGAEQWSELELPSREMYWVRGRSLSRMGRYEEAAEVYRQCIERFPEDDYARHYFAYNRDHAGIGDGRTEEEYRRAIHLRPESAWWNSRLVTYLIERGQPLAARNEWKDAIARIDPNGEGGVWLALHFHRWVVQAWLDQGEVELARQAFDAISMDAIEKGGRIERLQQALEDAEEARRLGESVYPATVGMAERWKRPALLPEKNSSGASLRGWYPARVIDADGSKVLLAIGVPPAGKEAPRVALKEMTASEWSKAARTTQMPDGFWEIGTYEDGETQALPLSDRGQEAAATTASLRFLKTWANSS